jgi:hypothetical protein
MSQQGTETGVIYARVPLSLKARVRKYARRLGLSETAAVAVLLDKALVAEGVAS